MDFEAVGQADNRLIAQLRPLPLPVQQELLEHLRSPEAVRARRVQRVAHRHPNHPTTDFLIDLEASETTRFLASTALAVLVRQGQTRP